MSEIDVKITRLETLLEGVAESVKEMKADRKATHKDVHTAVENVRVKLTEIQETVKDVSERLDEIDAELGGDIEEGRPSFRAIQSHTTFWVKAVRYMIVLAGVAGPIAITIYSGWSWITTHLK